jgi:hypothetical protein
VAFRPHGHEVAAAGFDGEVVLLDAATGAPVRQFVPVPLDGAAAEPAPSNGANNRANPGATGSPGQRQ